MIFKMDLETYKLKLDLTNIPSNPQDRFNYCKSKVLAHYKKENSLFLRCLFIVGVGSGTIPFIFLFFVSGILFISGGVYELSDLKFEAGIYHLGCGIIYALIFLFYILLMPIVFRSGTIDQHFATKLKKMTEPDSICTFNSKIRNRRYKEIKAKHILAGLISKKVANDYDEFIVRLDASEEKWIEFRDQELIPDLIPIDN
jgi:hypothetical protein